MKPLETKNVFLQSVSPDDGPDAFAVLGDPRVTRYMSMEPFPDVNFVQGCIDRWKAKEGTGDWYVYGIYEKESRKLVGIINTCGLHHGNPVIGYCLNPKVWGKGYMTEALTAFCKLLFDDGYTCLVAEAADENKASNRVLEKAGFGYIGSTEEPLCEEKPEPIRINGYRLLKQTARIESLRRTEEDLQRLMSTAEPFSPHLLRNKSDELPDMWYLNQFSYGEAPTEQEVARALDDQKARGDRFLLLEGRTSLPMALRQKFSLEEECTLTMELNQGRTCDWARNTHLEFRNLHEDPSIEADLVQLDRNLYGPEYGDDFTVRKDRYWMETARKSKGLNYYGAYWDGKLAGSVYSFRSGENLLLDGLLVDRWARNQYVATSLLAACIEREGGIPFLHADADDTPKEMYLKLGFRLADYSYSSLTTW